MPDARRCSYCKRPEGKGHAPKCRKMTRACKICARLAPEKCKWHGGSSHSTAFRAMDGRPKPARAATEGKSESARAAAEVLLGHLRTIRARFDERIGNVEDLVSLL